MSHGIFNPSYLETRLPMGGPGQPGQVTSLRLAEFRRRRLQLAICRGAARVAVLIVVVLVMAVTVDAFFESVVARWLSSLAVYATALTSLYAFCLRPWFEPAQWVQEAAHWEEQDPRLQEHLLSAVELSQVGADPVHGSLAFRQQLQRQVDRAIAPVDVQQLMPWSTIRCSLWAGSTAASLLIVLACVPGLWFSHRLARVLLPAADLGRVSHIAIRIEQPMPPTKRVPQGDVLAVTAVVHGSPPETVWLEMNSADGGLRRKPMTTSESTGARSSIGGLPGDTSKARPERGARFGTTLAVEDVWLDYRLVAEGASTPWYRLTTRPRPHAIAFEKKITLPEYAKAEPKTEIDEHGHVETLVGSHVELAVQVDQPIDRAELRWETTGRQSQPSTQESGDSADRVTQLSWNANRQRFVGQFSVERSRRYRLFLQSSETGFTNEFSPSFQVVALKDNAPQVQWVRPQTPSIVASPTELVPLVVRVRDELPILEWYQEISLGGGAWQRSALDFEVGETPEDRAWDFDLMGLAVEAGDYIETRVVIRDLAGQRSQSAPLRILISSTSVPLGASPAEELRRTLADRVTKLAEEVSERVQTLGEANPQDDQSPAKEVTSARQHASDLADWLRAEVSSAIEEWRSVLSADLGAVSHMEMRLAGEVLAQLGTDEVHRFADLATSATSSEELVTAAQRLTSRGQSLATHLRTAVTYDTIQRHSEQLSRLERAQLELAEVENASAGRIRRRHEILLRQMKDVQQAMLDSLDAVRRDSRERLRRSSESLGHMIDQVERDKESRSAVKLSQLAASTARRLAEAKLISRIDGNLTEGLQRSHRWLHQNVDRRQRPLLDLSSVVQERAAEGLASEVVRQLALRRGIWRSGDSDSRTFAKDLGTARRAVEAIVHRPAPPGEQASQIREIAGALETLEAIAVVSSANAQVEQLLRAERWELDSHAALTEHPRLWNAFVVHIRHAAQLARQARLPQDVVDRLERLSAGPAGQEVQKRVEARLWSTEPPLTAEAPLEEITQAMGGIRRALDPWAQQARRRLEQWAPSISELAERAATDTEQLGRETQTLSEAIRRDEIPDTSLGLEQLDRQLVELQRPMDDLREALVDQADAQNVLDASGLEAARRADAAIDVVDRAEEQTRQSLENVVATGDRDATVDSLSAAAEQQASAADALRQLAGLWDQADSPDHSETDLPGRSWEPIEALAEQLKTDEANRSTSPYQQAERLARLAGAEPEDVLQQLERELQTNPPMQEEMSQIARAAARQTLEQLGHATRQQHAVPPSLEASDPRLRGQKQLLLHDLGRARENAFQMLGFLLSEASLTAGAAKESAVEREVQNVEEALQKALDASDGLSSDLAFERLQSMAVDLQNALTDIAARLDGSRGSLEAAMDKEVHRNGTELSRRRREMKDRQRRIQQQDTRHAQQFERAQKQRWKQAEEHLQRAERRVESLEKTLAQQVRELEEQPDREEYQQRVVKSRQQLALARITVEAERAVRDGFQQRLEVTEQWLQELHRRPLPELTKINPSAELASRISGAGAERSRYLAEALVPWIAREPPRTRASAEPLKSHLQQEATIREEVGQAAEHLARAARHEARLLHQGTSQQLEELAQGIDHAAAEEIRHAQNSLASAAAEASRSSSPSGQASAEATAGAIRASHVAENAMQDSASELRALLAVGSVDESTPSGFQSTQEMSAQGTPAQDAEQNTNVLGPKEMAQLLDELDRMLHGEQNFGEQEDNSERPPSDGQKESSPDERMPSTLTEAAKQLASRMSQSREPLPTANSDLGMATESQVADVEPQGPVAVRVLEVTRTDGSWGELKRRNAEGTLETRRDALAPQYRKPVEAYFRSLSVQSQSTPGASP